MIDKHTDKPGTGTNSSIKPILTQNVKTIVVRETVFTNLPFADTIKIDRLCTMKANEIL